MKFLVRQMEKTVCKIQKSNNVTGTGFLCKITNEFMLYPKQVLFTCNHVLAEEDLTLGKEINLIFKNNIIKIIKINKLRTIYTNKDYDVTIIEILRNDRFEESEMLELDNNMYNDGLANYYKNRQVYIIHYPNGNEVRYSSDLVKAVYVDNNKIEHLCSTETGSSGGPIINLENGCVFAIHVGNKGNKINLGSIIKNPIDEFYNLKENKKNEIILILEIEKDDINKDIYYLDNINYTDDLVVEKKPDSSLTELNESNVELYINNKIFKYSKFFKPDKEGIYTIKLNINIKMQNYTQMFHGCDKIKSIDLSNFNTENVTNILYMFSGCKNLKNIDLSNFITDKVTTMSYMFYDCKNLENIDLSTFNTENVEDMSGMFCGCNIKSLELKYLNTKNVTNITHMFYRCENLKNLDLSLFDTQNVKNMSGLFAGCHNLNNIDLSSFNTKNTFYMSFLFYDCKSMTNINLSSFDTKNVDNMNSMFNNCINLRTVDLSSFDTRNVINMGKMFYCCKSLVNLDLSSFNTNNVVYMYELFYGCESLYNLDISSFNCSNVKNLNNNNPFGSIMKNIFGTDCMFKIFKNCNSLTNLSISNNDYNNPDFMLQIHNQGLKIKNLNVK